MAPPTYNDLVASILAVMVAGAVIYLAVTTSTTEVVSALTLGLGLVMGWHFRGRVQPPTPPTPPTL